ncbi:MAG: antibiotic biosynthesis monooxygenase [Pseudomonadota bacterium]
MIQVIYRWEVPLVKQAAFIAAWEKTTVTIRETIVGARGSLCIVSVDRPTEILTVAKWDRLEQWQAFIGGDMLVSMKTMHELGTRVSAEAFEQRGDFTV